MIVLYKGFKIGSFWERLKIRHRPCGKANTSIFATNIHQSNTWPSMKKVFVSVLAFAFLMVLSQNACYYDNEVEQYGVVSCDTTSISFSQDVLPIINANCISCHVQGGVQSSSPLTNYNEIKGFSDEIKNRVNGIGGIMPPAGPMSECNQSKIEAWVRAGAPNN
jgi:hypothetical protein